MALGASGGTLGPVILGPFIGTAHYVTEELRSGGSDSHLSSQ